MSTPSVIFVTERTWPFVDQVVVAVEQMAEALGQLGWSVQVVCQSGPRSWPARFQLSNVTVNRLPVAARGLFGSFLRSRALHQWIDAHATPRDVIIGCGVNDFVWHAAEVADVRDLPFCWWPLSTVTELQNSAPGKRIAHKLRQRGEITTVIVETAEHADFLRHAGFEADQVSQISAGVVVAPAALNREEARLAIASIQPLLAVKPASPLAAYIGPLDSEQELNALVAAWNYVASRLPHARLWFVGDGPGGDLLIDQIRRHDHTRDTIVTGWFDELDDVYAAIDLVVVPKPTRHPCRLLLGALAQGRRVLYRNTAPCWLDESKFGVACRGDTPTKFAESILAALHECSGGKRINDKAQDFVAKHHNISQTATAFADVCRRLQVECGIP